jgi:hypothetical protein
MKPVLYPPHTAPLKSTAPSRLQQRSLLRFDAQYE